MVVDNNQSFINLERLWSYMKTEGRGRFHTWRFGTRFIVDIYSGKFWFDIGIKSHRDFCMTSARPVIIGCVYLHLTLVVC